MSNVLFFSFTPVWSVKVESKDHYGDIFWSTILDNGTTSYRYLISSETPLRRYFFNIEYIKWWLCMKKWHSNRTEVEVIWLDDDWIVRPSYVVRFFTVSTLNVKTIMLVLKSLFVVTQILLSSVGGSTN